MERTEFEDQYVNRIVCGDCLEVMRGWPDGCVDVVLTDPPYGVGQTHGTFGKTRAHKVSYSSFEDSERYVIEVVVPAIVEAIRVADRVIVTPGWKCLRHYPQWDGFGCFYSPAATGLQRWGFADAQPILYYGIPYDIGVKICKCSMVLTGPPSCKDHPCSKPLREWSQIVESRSLPSDLILDPFCGSGTTCVAAKMLGRRYIGIDISEEYCEIARSRLEAVETGVSVAEAKAGQLALFESRTTDDEARNHQ